MPDVKKTLRATEYWIIDDSGYIWDRWDANQYDALRYAVARLLDADEDGLHLMEVEITGKEVDQ